MGEALTCGDNLEHSMPHLRSQARGSHLIVHERPFLTLPAELHNSSFSCPPHMRQTWAKLKESNINTILANVSWEDVEPEEGRFGFSKLDQCIDDARQHGFKLLLLWFGAFKNGKSWTGVILQPQKLTLSGKSSYAPSWVKTDPKRFPRMELRKAGSLNKIADVLSILVPEVVKADSAAFTVLIQHIKDIDHQFSTIVMIQVENEVGLL